MKLIEFPETPEQSKATGACVAIGVFDGLHCGHQSVILKAVNDSDSFGSRALAVTFDNHPGIVIEPQTAPPSIYPNWKKIQLFKELKLSGLVLIEFTKIFAKLSPHEFIQKLIETVGSLHSVSVGVDFRFGFNRSGDINTLKKLGDSMGFSVNIVDPVYFMNLPISSTRIRNAISSGDLNSANQMLGRPFAICGTVIEGDKLGRKLGFPTANLHLENIVLPPTGVYLTKTKLKDKTMPGLLNIGIRPTLSLNQREIRVENHIIGFNSDIYGERLEIEVIRKIRNEIKFDSLQQLKQQLSKDLCLAEKYFQEQKIL
jgi:riboflavin kinase/FMN adenylyltransferase